MIPSPKWSTYFLSPNRRVLSMYKWHSQWIQFSVCKLYWCLKWEILEPHVLHVITPRRPEGRFFFCQPAACIYSKSHMTRCDTTFEKATSYYLHGNGCQTPRLNCKNTAFTKALPLLPCWEWETVMNFENTNTVNCSRKSNPTAENNIELRIKCWPTVREEAEDGCQTMHVWVL